MRWKVAVIATGFAASAAGGCAFSNQQIQLKATIQNPVSETAAGRAVHVRVADERLRTIIGRRRAGGNGGSITTQQDLSTLVRDGLQKGLRRYGFTIAAVGAADVPVLAVELRALDYEAVAGWLSLDIIAWGALEATCKSGARRYQTFYRVDRSRGPVSFPPPVAKNTALVNRTLSDLLMKPLTDRNMLECLAPPAAPPTPSS